MSGFMSINTLVVLWNGKKLLQLTGGCPGLQLTHLPASTYVAGGTPELDLPSGILQELVASLLPPRQLSCKCKTWSATA